LHVLTGKAPEHFRLARGRSGGLPEFGAQNIRKFKIAVIVLVAQRNSPRRPLPLIPGALAAIATPGGGQVVCVTA